MKIEERITKYLKENSTEDAYKTLKANIEFYKKMDSDDKKVKEIKELMDDLLDYYNENKSFSPGQAKAIFNISQGIKKMTG